MNAHSDLAKADKAKHFQLDLSKLTAVADKVIQVTKKDYPNLDIPYHSRWRHFVSLFASLSFIHLVLIVLNDCMND